MIVRRIVAAGARSLFYHYKKELIQSAGEGCVCGRQKSKRNVPPSPSARKQVSDGTGETASLVLLHGVP
jgi:hypothetical protein